MVIQHATHCTLTSGLASSSVGWSTPRFTFVEHNWIDTMNVVQVQDSKLGILKQLIAGTIPKKPVNWANWPIGVDMWMVARAGSQGNCSNREFYKRRKH